MAGHLFETWSQNADWLEIYTADRASQLTGLTFAADQLGDMGYAQWVLLSPAIFESRLSEKECEVPLRDLFRQMWREF